MKKTGFLQRIKMFLLCCGLFFISGEVMAYGAKTDLRREVDGSEALFSMESNALRRKYPVLRWRDPEQTLLYCPPRFLSRFQYGTYPVYELQFRIRNRKVSSMEVTVYTRGDAGDMRKKNARQIHQALLQDLQGLTRVSPKRSYTFLQSLRTSVDTFLSPRIHGELLLISDRRKNPEKILLRFSGPGSQSPSLKESYRTHINTGNLPSKVIRKNGDTYVRIPMVDQGSKGYCVPATVSRVLMHYGSSMDMHSLARMMNSRADEGTFLDKTIDTLKKIDRKLRVRFQEKYRYNYRDNADRYAAFLRSYNKIARKMGSAKLKYSTEFDDMRLDYRVFQALRLKKPWRDFSGYIRSNIDRGIPVMWSILVFPKNRQGPVNVSGHLRLITGYNSTRGELIYSDSWGPGHEKKRMKLSDAWVITTRLFTLEPSR